MDYSPQTGAIPGGQWSGRAVPDGRRADIFAAGVCLACHRTLREQSRPWQQRAIRAFQFAKVKKEKGQEVKIFLVNDAIHWAQLGMAAGIRAATGEEMKPFIDYLWQHDTEIVACKA